LISSVPLLIYCAQCRMQRASIYIDQIIGESEACGGLIFEAVHFKLGVFSGADKSALIFGYELAC